MEGHIRDLYEVEGAFYQYTNKGKSYLCRRLAVIQAKESTYQEHYDALFIMVNPGSCQPLDSSYNVPVIQTLSDSVPLVKAKSDPTQRQLMRVMAEQKWNKTAIFNLSDLCEGNLSKFSELMKSCRHSFPHHSIFSDERAKELQNLFLQNRGPVIVAWGTNSCISDLAKKALFTLQMNDIEYMGKPYANYPYYYHANPHLQSMKQEWLEYMSEQLQARSV
ncbi:hypothetical protein [Mesobacillus zeae]|uniref:DUF1643 domain-containing protein n=1 Tax=Mesobacillus zeae TaxID=1917180 RepID=A0A398B1X8_9BACI|nr:hypothetical protein [Mesobacillus zeae]RID81950.1 hypothetical protein D1970_20495 [Mesobacillus zeae]